MDANLPPGKRVTDVRYGLNLEPIEHDKEYTVAITTKLGNSRGFGVDFIADAPRVMDEEFEVPLTDMIVEYLNKRDMEPIEVTQASRHGRVIELHKGEDNTLLE